MGVGRVGRLRKDADTHILFRQRHGIHVVGHLAQNVRLRADTCEPLADGLHPGFAAGHDQWLTHQTGERQLRPRQLRQGVLPGDDSHPGLPSHGKALQMLHVVGGGNDGQVHQSPVQLVQHVIAAAVPQLVTHQWVFLPESGDPAGRQVGGPALHHAEADGPGELAAQRGQVPPGLFRKVHHLNGPLQQQGARFRQRQPPLTPDEQLNAQLFLQSLDLVAERRLAHLQLFRGSGKVELLRHGNEILECAEVHRCIPSFFAMCRLPEQFLYYTIKI